MQADRLLKEKLGLKAQARSNSWHRSSLQETLTRYLNFMHFFAFCLLSLLKTVVRFLRCMLQSCITPSMPQCGCIQKSFRHNTLFTLNTQGSLASIHTALCMGMQEVHVACSSASFVYFVRATTAPCLIPSYQHIETGQASAGALSA